MTSGVCRVSFPHTGQVSPEVASQPDSSQTTPGAVAPSCTSSVLIAATLPACRQLSRPSAADLPTAAFSSTPEISRCSCSRS